MTKPNVKKNKMEWGKFEPLCKICYVGFEGIAVIFCNLYSVDHDYSFGNIISRESVRLNICFKGFQFN